MNKLGLVGLGLIAILSQPLEAQRRATAPSAQTWQTQRDVEFLELYKEVNALEAKLANEPPETENREFTKFYMENGKLVGQPTIAGPPSISDKILETKYLKILKLASRFGINFDPNETGIFTLGDYLVMSKFLEGYAIFNQNLVIVTSNSWGGEKSAEYHYRYQVLRSDPAPNSTFKILKSPEVADGPIPLFETQNFSGIFSKIRQLERDNRMKYEDSNDPRHNFNQVPEFQGLNYDNTRAHFAYAQLTNIGMMLLKMIEDGEELNGLPNPKINMHKPIPSVGGNRIILSERSFGNTGIDFNDKDWIKKAEYERSLDGDITLSIASNGTVDYFFQPSYSIAGEYKKPVYRNLKMEFHKFNK
ncbi:MAG TPA: hypothetical protein VJJ52_02895 [Candidatus Nanoarchaeia archaeon]|nr:hypothetical protein [Candidatus Nanoarchaeia archaeon]